MHILTVIKTAGITVEYAWHIIIGIIAIHFVK
jgi:hypothetical protein